MLTGYYNFYQINKLLFNVGQSNMVEFWKLNDANRSAEHILFILLLWCIILGLFPDLVFLTV
jgi:NADH:ubiquinone oxidoreductase subunit 4 (subunit M)